MASPLRIGLLIDSWTVPQWVHRVIADIQSSGIARVALIVKNEQPVEKKKSFLEKIFSYRGQLLYLLYKKIDDLKNRILPDAFQPTNFEALVSDCPVLCVTPRKRKYYDYFEEKDLTEILKYDLDVALRFGFNILMDKALAMARHGVWSYHHGDNLTMRGGPAGFWEVMEGRPTTGSVLQILTPELDNGRIIYRSYAATDPFSVRKNRNNYYWKSSAFVLRKLKDLAERGPEGMNHVALDPDYRPYSSRIYKTPTNAEMGKLLFRMIQKYVGRQIRNLFYQEQWFVALRIKEEAPGPDEAFYHFTPLFPPRDRFWADPFPVKKGDKFFVFIEEYLERKKKGHISVIEIDRQGAWSAPKKVLERDYHLAYPFIFEWQDEYYMIPETSSNRTLELYRSVSFPHQWELEKVLMTDVNAVDATLAEMQGRWWLFVNMAEVEGNVKNWDELYLFHSASPLGPWEPHARNPVKSDVRRSRPAGRIFSRKDHLYRPSQDCSVRYGYAISINQILRISPTEYVEKEVSRILPRWRKDVIANHTLNHVESLTVIDGLIRRARL